MKTVYFLILKDIGMKRGKQFSQLMHAYDFHWKQLLLKQFKQLINTPDSHWRQLLLDKITNYVIPLENKRKIVLKIKKEELAPIRYFLKQNKIVYHIVEDAGKTQILPGPTVLTFISEGSIEYFNQFSLF